MAKFAEPKVTIAAATEWDPARAAALLIFTKSTRLEMTPGGLEQIVERCESDPAWMRSELDYMSKTIRSSWEFLDVTFVVENISRATAQQVTRTRVASFAMQSQRVTNMENASFSRSGVYEDDELNQLYEEALDRSMEYYGRLVDGGMKLEDARGVLPLNVQCRLVEKYNFRTLASLIPARTSYRAQGEYREIARQMRDQLFQLWPWAYLFFRPKFAIADSLLDQLVQAIPAGIEGEQKLLALASKIRDQLNLSE